MLSAPCNPSHTDTPRLQGKVASLGRPLDRYQRTVTFRLNHRRKHFPTAPVMWLRLADAAASCHPRPGERRRSSPGCWIPTLPTTPQFHGEVWECVGLNAAECRRHCEHSRTFAAWRYRTKGHTA